ncbi:MAG: hypothetical protein WC975_00525 [Phycisphaerae bacterium]
MKALREVYQGVYHFWDCVPDPSGHLFRCFARLFFQVQWPIPAIGSRPLADPRSTRECTAKVSAIVECRANVCATLGDTPDRASLEFAPLDVRVNMVAPDAVPR